jgi:hypothetical protein
MANRIVGNVYIIDTGSANVALPVPNPYKVMSIRAWFSDTSGKAVFSYSDTSNVFCILSANRTPVTVGGITDESNLGGLNFDELKVPVLTAGTAWIYLG